MCICSIKEDFLLIKDFQVLSPDARWQGPWFVSGHSDGAFSPFWIRALRNKPADIMRSEEFE
jgi:hypothetical protein